jgi:hypothetical protein
MLVEREMERILLTDEEEETIETNLNDLLNLSIYTLPTLRINTQGDMKRTWQRFLCV